MKLLSFEIVPSSELGGQELSMVDECVGLARRGHDVTLAYTYPGDLLERYEGAGVRTLHVRDIAIDSARRLRSVFSCVGTLFATAPVDADAVVINGYYVTPLGSAVSRVKRVPLVCHLRIFPPEAFSRQWKYGLRGVSRFVAVSRPVRDAWVAVGCEPDLVDVVHDGIDTEAFSPRRSRATVRQALGVPTDAFTVLYFGRLDKSKNLESLLRAFAGLALPPSRARLLIAGQPVDHASPAAGCAYIQGLRRLAGELGVGEAVHWLGVRKDIPDLLGASDASALFAYNEAFGRATVESLACGVPPVVTKHGGSAEIMTGELQSLTFDVEDVEAATRIFRSLHGLQGRDPGFAERARAHVVARFSKGAMVRDLEASLERAIAHGRVRRAGFDARRHARAPSTAPV
jgi:glycosyltransferase involved in cell wall biosynthesis